MREIPTSLDQMAEVVETVRQQSSSNNTAALAGVVAHLVEIERSRLKAQTDAQRLPPPVRHLSEERLERLLDYLFTNGAGFVADRFMLVDRKNQGMGGFSRNSLRAALKCFLASDSSPG